MIKLKKLVLLSCLLSLLNSCVNSTKNEQSNTLINTNFEEIRVNNQYSIELPTFMNESDDLNPEASLQYQNIFKETYVVVINESKEEFRSIFEDLGEYDQDLSAAKNYKDIQLQFLEEEVVINKINNIESSIINGLPFEITEVDATADGIDIGYTIAFVEGIKEVYMIMVWTLQNRHKKYSGLFKKITKSFKEFSRSKGVKKEIS